MVPTVVASHSSAGFTLFGRLATPNMCNEAEPSSRDATARAFASPSLSEQGRPHSLRVWLHDFRPIIMTNSSQLTRTTKLAWRFPKYTKSEHTLSFFVYFVYFVVPHRLLFSSLQIPHVLSRPRFPSSVFIRSISG